MEFHIQVFSRLPLYLMRIPAIKAVSPQAPVTDEFVGDDCNHNGAFFLLDNFGFYNFFEGAKSENGESYSRLLNAVTMMHINFFLKWAT